MKPLELPNLPSSETIHPGPQERVPANQPISPDELRAQRSHALNQLDRVSGAYKTLDNSVPEARARNMQADQRYSEFTQELIDIDGIPMTRLELIKGRSEYERDLRQQIQNAEANTKTLAATEPKVRFGIFGKGAHDAWIQQRDEAARALQEAHRKLANLENLRQGANETAQNLYRETQEYLTHHTQQREDGYRRDLERL